MLRGFRQFDAPLVLTYDRELGPGAVCHFDLGALCYGIVLAAWDRGLGSVINGQGIMRSDIVREVSDSPQKFSSASCNLSHAGGTICGQRGLLLARGN